MDASLTCQIHVESERHDSPQLPTRLKFAFQTCISTPTSLSKVAWHIAWLTPSRLRRITIISHSLESTSSSSFGLVGKHPSKARPSLVAFTPTNPIAGQVLTGAVSASQPKQRLTTPAVQASLATRLLVAKQRLTGEWSPQRQPSFESCCHLNICCIQMYWRRWRVLGLSFIRKFWTLWLNYWR